LRAPERAQEKWIPVFRFERATNGTRTEPLIVLSMFRPDPTTRVFSAETVPILGSPSTWGVAASWHTG
jgi:hypothetical protein